MSRKISFRPQAWDDYMHWHTQDDKTVKKINRLLKDLSRHGFSGLGKAEILRHDKVGYKSMHIDKTNRLVYEIADDEVIVVSCRNHYDNK
jgi:toxin YoeB